jgi:RNA polymerase sigma-70 factor (ECF subfamily)
LFNEGYSASSGDSVVRLDLCEEAARLCHLVCEHPKCNAPATFALMALMLFHAARLESRAGDRGQLMLLEDQDRSRWNQALLARARWALDRAATGTAISSFHLEAGIALLHCSAPSFEQTDWRSILKLYDVLVRMQPSPIYQLNRGIVVAHLEGPAAGIREIESLRGNPALRNYHLFDAVLGELYRRSGDLARARAHLLRARDATRSACERALLEHRITACEDRGGE